MAGAEIQIDGQGPRLAVRPRRDHAHLRRRLDLLDRQSELRRHLTGVSAAGVLGPGMAALAETRVRHLDQQRRPVADRDRVAAPRGEQHDPFRTLVEGAQQDCALGRRQVLEPVHAQQPLAERGGESRVGDSVRALSSRTPMRNRGTPAAAARIAPASGPQTTSGSRVRVASNIEIRCTDSSRPLTGWGSRRTRA